MDALQLVPVGTLLFFLPAALLLLRGALSQRPHLPPGPPSLPLLGSVVWLTNSVAEIEPLLQRLFQRHGPIVALRMGARLSVFVADRHLAHTALVERGAALADRPQLVSSSSRRRAPGCAACSPTSSGRRRRPTCRRMWWRRSNTPCSASWCSCASASALDEPAVSAIAVAEREALVYRSRNMPVFAFLTAVTKHLLRARLDTVRVLRRRVTELILPLIDARRRYKINRRGGAGSEPRKQEETTFEHSYVDTLPSGDGSERPLTDDEIVLLCAEFLDGGTDTTSTALQWIMAELVKNPTMQEKLYTEITAITTDDKEEVYEEDVHKMPYLKAVILEGLRKHPPAHFVLPHKAAEDMEIGGYLIPKGTTVNFMVAEMSLDEREWENPTEFSPERFLPGGDGEGVDVTGTKEIRMMPFGVGRRICPGLGVAMLHLEYFVANMVRDFEWMEVPGHEVDFTEKNEFTVVMKKPLLPRLVPRMTTQISTNTH
ncbi:unnamed protein product [Urochloa decumbens]|uniref:Cytochrome P450 n=1 Tax=Urochloa decumbens TaxID=240449 RepID=A0ABC9EVP5_9POAL